MEQDLQQAITTGRFTQAGVTLALETGMAATENLLWIKLSAEGGTLQGRADLYLAGQDIATTGDVPVVERRFEQDVLVPAGAVCALRMVDGGREFTVTPGKPVFVIASICIYKDAVHEGSGDNVNPIVSLAFVRMVMNLAIDMSRELGVDAARHEKWSHIRDHISAYPTCRLGDLKRWWPAHLPRTDENRDLPIFRYTEQGTEWWRSNTLGIQHIYPAGGIGLDSPPELLERALNQIRVMNRWVDFNGMNSFYAAAARVGYDPNIILKEMRSMIEGIGAPNGMIPNNPHGMEHQSIVPNAIQEMLLQSHEGVIRCFPCWPKDQNARFGTLRARGAFLVSAEMKAGVVRGVKIISEKGRACTVHNPWPGKSVRVIRNGKPAESLSGERFVLKTGVGETIIIEPHGT